MDNRILLIDVDGTLVCPEQKFISDPVVAGLEALQRRGIPVVVATGRGAYAVRPAVMSGLRADYLICSNGAYIADGAGNLLWDQPMNMDQFDAICALGREGGSIGFSFEDGYYCYYHAERFHAFFREHNGDDDALHAGALPNRHLRGMPYAGFGLVAPARVAAFNAERSDLRMTSYADDAYDINQIDCNKATGAARLLRLLGMDWRQVVFIGDGDNDIELLQSAGLGIAMGNGKPAARQAADELTGTVLEDGVLQAIQRVFGV